MYRTQPHIHSIHFCIAIVLCLLSSMFTSCREHVLSDDPTLKVTFSCDTLCFDTVFTGVGTSTRRVMVYNQNANALRISKIWMEHGDYFHVNIDGETDHAYMQNLELAGHDSMYLFVRLHVDPQASNAPVSIHDAVHFSVNGNTCSLALEAYGQDVHLVRNDTTHLSQFDRYTFTADKPYLIYDTMLVAGNVTIQAGAQLYFHQGASLYVAGNLTANGTLEQPIRLMGDRTDNLFEHVPYAYAAGQWSGVFLLDGGKMIKPAYKLNYVDITSGNVGLYCYSERTKSLPTIELTNSRIHNHALYGLVLMNMDARVVNTEISNAASYCVYSSGGEHRFIHSTIASYFNSTDVRIQSTPREDVAALYISDLSKTDPETRVHCINCVVCGVRSQNILLATPMQQYYPGQFVGCFLKQDTLRIPNAHGNRYWQQEDEAVFRNTFFKYQDYTYYDFRLDSLSPAIGIADSVVALSYPTDRLGRARHPHPDAGCYEHE